MLSTHPLVVPRLQTLKLAEQLNPKFHKPHIVGGYLRDIALNAKPNDCDVVFQGYQLNQPGIVEAVREAEKRLGIEPYPEWDFENAMATGMCDDFVENTIGKYSHHTDYLTVLLLDTDGRLFITEEQTVSDIENKVYDLRFAGIEVWATHRGEGRTYASCIVGDLTRGLYLCSRLNLKQSAIVTFLLQNFDSFFEQLEEADQQMRRAYWKKKTKGAPEYKQILDKFKIKSLTV